jgi:hypothetical protein
MMATLGLTQCIDMGQISITVSWNVVGNMAGPVVVREVVYAMEDPMLNSTIIMGRHARCIAVHGAMESAAPGGSLVLPGGGATSPRRRLNSVAPCLRTFARVFTL